ncbi:DUF2332 domain-containing protein [Salimicrobium humidisoli]|uniref:DUF2332 domain-containing protein n=1 Tax=Salimicrobium humidisoli TaxID=2029857 RepID=A0ABX4HT62_9BACI|nr:DUF2332 domain-containing protein [Salimicrobium humidisoli]PBB06275.1 hypothetical protein CKW00_04395 [Salimicrobium humidisoli]
MKKLLTDTFKDFAEKECIGSSPLYRELSLKIAEDEDILDLCTEVEKSQPIPNLLFGAVHYLLLKGTEHELKDYYPSLVDFPKRDCYLYRIFKDFCLENKEEIKVILKNNIVQTNEVRRCAYLFPVFSYIYAQTQKPLSLIEIGTSAGLQLLWDQYAYSYGTEETYGKKDSAVHLESKVREGRISEHLLNDVPPVAERIGVDLNIVDVTVTEEKLWLEALIWPEHADRRRNFLRAAGKLQQHPLSLLEGDGVSLLPEIAATMPEDSTLCIFHTHVANQLPEEKKSRLEEYVKDISERRQVFHIYNNMNDRRLHVDHVLKGKATTHTLGDTDVHGRWFDWKIDLKETPPTE